MLYFGAEGLVKGSASVALRKGISPLVVGLTIVAFGTSSPEFVVSISAVFNGKAGIAVGNIIGSNICNIALILGFSSLITPIKVNIKLIKTDILIMIFASILLYILILDGNIGRIDGIILFMGIVCYTWYTLYIAKKEKANSENQAPEKARKPIIDYIFIIGGLFILVIGANFFIDGAVKIAKVLKVSDVIIGLSIVALGTSLPEMATSIVAAVKKEGDISIGNIVGSNIFNILCILGLAAIIQPMILRGDNSVNFIDIIVMIAMAVILLPLAWTKLQMSRLEGLFLLLLYIGYIYYRWVLKIQLFNHFLKDIKNPINIL